MTYRYSLRYTIPYGFSLYGSNLICAMMHTCGSQYTNTWIKYVVKYGIDGVYGRLSLYASINAVLKYLISRPLVLRALRLAT